MRFQEVKFFVCGKYPGFEKLYFHGENFKLFFGPIVGCGTFKNFYKTSHL